jgi:hypothetical protein
MPEAPETAAPRDFDPRQAIHDTVLHLASMAVDTDADLEIFNAKLIAASRSCGVTATELRRQVEEARARRVPSGFEAGAAGGDNSTSNDAEPDASTSSDPASELRKPKITVGLGPEAMQFIGTINAQGRRYAEFRPDGLPVLYCQGSRLIRPEILPPRRLADGTMTGRRALLVHAERAWVHNRLESAFDFSKTKTDRQGRRSEVPAGFPGGLLDRFCVAAHEGAAQPLRSVAMQPFVHSDGSIVRKHGYNAPSRTLCLFPDFDGIVPEHPTLDEAREAVRLVLELLADFPFKTPSCRGAAIAFMLHAHLRYMLDVVPAWLVTAPESGSGKDLLVKAMTQFATGTIVHESAWPERDHDEQRKTLLTMAEQATNVAHFANLSSGQTLASATLDQVITAALLLGRRLGSNQTIAADNTMSLVFTGNMIGVASDTTRRVIVSTLTPGVEDPMARTDFAIPHLVRWLRENEPQIRAAMLTLAAYAVQARASRAAPEPGYVPLASFEMWDSFVRRCVIELLGSDHDPIITLRQRRARAIYSGDRLVMRTLIDGLIDRRMGTFSLGRQADADAIADILRPLLDHQDVHAANIVKKMFSEERGSLSADLPPSMLANRVGRFIETHVDHVSGNHKIERVLDANGNQQTVRTVSRNRVNLWMVVLVSQPDVPFTDEPHHGFGE